MGVKLESFLALEASLSSRVIAAWGKMSEGVLPLVYARLRQNDVLGATQHVDNLDLAPIVRQCRDYVRYVSYAAILSGAARLNPKLDEAKIIGSGRLTAMVNRTTASFASAIAISVGDQVKTKLFDAIRDHDLSLPQTNFGHSEGNVLFKAENATLLKPFTMFRNPINDEAQRMIQMISSLHTSRLANFGFTEEADLLGVTQYMVNEQLDNRICPICEEMHGQVFDVSDARSLLDRTLTTDNPDDLAMLQPWPSQNKATLAKLRAMSKEDIVAQGWHIPPYHPWCRGQLVPVGDVPVISDTSSYGAAFPDYGTGDFSPDMVDAETFDTLGIDITQEQADAWATETDGAAPDEVLSLMTGMTPQEMADAAYNPITDTADSNSFGVDMQLLVNGTDEERLRAIIDLEGKFLGLQDALSAGVDFVYGQFDKAMTIRSLDGVSPDSLPDVMAALVGAAALTGIDKIEVNADLDPQGGMWSDYGALPSDADWNDARAQLKAAIESGDVDLTDEEKVDVLPLLEDSDSQAFWTLTDLDIGAVEDFLASIGLTVYIDLADEASAARFAEATAGATDAMPAGA